MKVRMEEEGWSEGAKEVRGSRAKDCLSMMQYSRTVSHVTETSAGPVTQVEQGVTYKHVYTVVHLHMYKQTMHLYVRGCDTRVTCV